MVSGNHLDRRVTEQRSDGKGVRSGTCEPGGEGMPEIVKMQIGNFGNATSRVPGRLDLIEGKQAIIGSAQAQTFDHGARFVAHRQCPISFVFRIAHVNHFSAQINVAPGELEQFAAPHSGLKGKANQWCEMCPLAKARIEQARFLAFGEVACAAIVEPGFFDFAARVGVEVAVIASQAENFGEQRKLVID